MPDNGFGNKANSFDFELRAYYINPDFKTANGGTGAVAIGFDDYVAFRDPNHQAGFPIVHENTTDRLLTGADFDPESIQRDHRRRPLARRRVRAVDPALQRRRRAARAADRRCPMA